MPIPPAKRITAPTARASWMGGPSAAASTPNAASAVAVLKGRGDWIESERSAERQVDEQQRRHREQVGVEGLAEPLRQERPSDRPAHDHPGVSDDEDVLGPGRKRRARDQAP